MDRRDYLKAVGLFSVLGIAGCIETTDNQTPPENLQKRTRIARSVDRIIDSEAGVLIYVHMDGGITSVPIKDTRLFEKETV